MVDLLRLFVGDFDDVHSFISNKFWGHDVEDNAYAIMRTKDGVVAMLHSSATLWQHQFSLTINLSGGTVELSGILSGSKSYGAETMTVARRGVETEGGPSNIITHYEHDPSWADEVSDFATAVIADAPIIRGSSAEALKTMQLVHRIYCADPVWRETWGLSDSTEDQGTGAI